MTKVTIDLDGLDEVLARLERVGSLAPLRAGVAAAALQIKGYIARYPPKRPREMRFTDRQRRFFFWALRQGIIEVPYQRGQSPGSEDLSQRWTIKLRQHGLTAIVGNNASYVRYVQDRDRQSSYHKGNWQTAQDVAERHAAEVTNIIRLAIEQALG